MLLKIGAYIRVSTEEQAQVVDGSLDSQKYRIKGYIEIRNSQEAGWGSLVESYIDDGYSAKDTKRPAYQRMMRDIRIGKINLILVTDLSRLSRSISDFCDLLKQLDNTKAKFLSIKEQFDSSTPAGEMMLFNMINLAQFERKQTSERVSTNFHSRALRGLINGGRPTLGFDRDPNNKGKLIVNEAEAVWVRKAFEVYLEKGSLRETAVALNELEIPRKKMNNDEDGTEVITKWTFDCVQNLLKNLAFVGKREINKNKKLVDQSTLKPWHRHQVVAGAWSPIVDQVTFDSVQKLMGDARKLHREKLDKAESRVFLLSGVLRCSECGKAMVGQSAHGANGVHRYYSHKEVIPNGDKKCAVYRINAEVVEDAVINHLDEAVWRSGHLNSIQMTIHSSTKSTDENLKYEILRVQKQLVMIDTDIESVFKLQLQSTISQNTARIMSERLDKLSEDKKKLVEYFEDLQTQKDQRQSSKEIVLSIEDRLLKFKQGLRLASEALKKRLLRNLFGVIFLNQDRLEAYYHLSVDQPDANQTPKTKKASGELPEAKPLNILKTIFTQAPASWQDSGHKIAYCGDWWR